VHGYQRIDNAIVQDVVENRLPDLSRFAVEIRRRLAASQPA
jgi:uncharacterized protein YutE (UPF0331/DUF86 family)